MQKYRNRYIYCMHLSYTLIYIYLFTSPLIPHRIPPIAFPHSPIIQYQIFDHKKQEPRVNTYTPVLLPSFPEPLMISPLSPFAAPIYHYGFVLRPRLPSTTAALSSVRGSHLPLRLCPPSASSICLCGFVLRPCLPSVSAALSSIRVFHLPLRPHLTSASPVFPTYIRAHTHTSTCIRVHPTHQVLSRSTIRENNMILSGFSLPSRLSRRILAASRLISNRRLLREVSFG